MAATNSLIISLRLSSPRETHTEREKAVELEQQLKAVLLRAGAGELDGDEWGRATLTLFFYGLDADRLLTIVEPILGTKVFGRCQGRQRRRRGGGQHLMG